MARAKPAAGGRPLSEPELTVLLKERFAAPEFAFIPQVRNTTGYSRRVRTADALAMSLWPSRGIELYGFEIKSDRRDWLREKGDPEKAEEIARFCHRWWVVAGEDDLVAHDELPAAWGLLVPRAGKLVAKKEAPLREAQAPTWQFIAALLRRAAEVVVPRAEIEAELERARKDARERAEERAKQQDKYLRDDLAGLKTRVHAFELASGVTLGRSWESPQRIGEAVKFILDGGLAREEARLHGLAATAREIVVALDARLADLPKPKTEAA